MKKYLSLTFLSLSSIIIASTLTFADPCPDWYAIDAYTQQWQGTVKVKKGDRVEIYADGKWSYSVWRSPVGPDGVDTPWATNVTDYCKHAALIGRINGGPIFCVGRHKSFIADRDGLLEFNINDGNTRKHDNSGKLRVFIKVNGVCK